MFEQNKNLKSIIMKKLTVLFFTILVLFSCNNDDNNSKNSATAKKLQGRWLWVSTTGGFGGPTQATPDQKIEIEFSGSTLKTYTNEKLSREQQYSIETKKSIFGGNREMLVTEKGLSITQEYYLNRLIEINGENLILTDECIDCGTSKYVRMK